MTGSTARISSTFGLALSLLVLWAVQPAATAGPISIEQSAATSTTEFVVSPLQIAGASDSGEQIEPADGNKLMFDVGSAEFEKPDDPALGGSLRQYAILIASFRLNRLSGPALSKSSENGDDLEDELAAAAYYALLEMNSDVAVDLLASYRTITLISGKISSALEAPLNALGLNNDSAVTQVDVGSVEKGPANKSFIPLDFFIRWIQFLLSIDAVPYYMIIFTMSILFVVFGKLLRRR